MAGNGERQGSKGRTASVIRWCALPLFLLYPTVAIVGLLRHNTGCWWPDDPNCPIPGWLVASAMLGVIVGLILFQIAERMRD